MKRILCAVANSPSAIGSDAKNPEHPVSRGRLETNGGLRLHKHRRGRTPTNNRGKPCVADRENLWCLLPTTMCKTWIAEKQRERNRFDHSGESIPAKRKNCLKKHPPEESSPPTTKAEAGHGMPTWARRQVGIQMSFDARSQPARWLPLAAMVLDGLVTNYFWTSANRPQRRRRAHTLKSISRSKKTNHQ